MFRSRPTSRIVAVIATLAILMAALAPSIGHALSGKTGELWAEVCSVAGLKLVKLDLPDASDADSTHRQAAGAWEHCPFCSSHTGMAALPPAPTGLPAAAGRSFPLPALFYQAPRPLFAWASAQSRAPPTNS